MRKLVLILALIFSFTAIAVSADISPPLSKVSNKTKDAGNVVVRTNTKTQLHSPVMEGLAIDEKVGPTTIVSTGRIVLFTGKNFSTSANWRGETTHILKHPLTTACTAFGEKCVPGDLLTFKF